MALLIASLALPANAAAPAPPGVLAESPPAPRLYTLSWSVAPATVGIVELAGDRALKSRWLARIVVAGGKGTTALWSTRQIRGLTMIDGRVIVQLGSQLRRALLGDVARGLFGAADLRLIAIARPQQPVFGGGLGGVAGARWTFASGLTLEAIGGGAVVVSTLRQRGSDTVVASVSLQGQAGALVGWSF